VARPQNRSKRKNAALQLKSREPNLAVASAPYLDLPSLAGAGSGSRIVPTSSDDDSLVTFKFVDGLQARRWMYPPWSGPVQRSDRLLI
jgi:hypothetical protein